MKTKTKGIIVAAFFAVILVTSTVTLALSSGPMQSPEDRITVTGTPEDSFPDLQRPRFCESSDAKSTQYVTEFKIPTKCTMPLSITTDGSGNVWFIQTNTGNIAKFDPQTQEFTEYPNPEWPEMARTMSWGMGYADDGSIWYTDDAHDALWRFSTNDGTYQPVGFPSNDDSLPQHLKVTEDHIIVNDFYGGKISFLSLQQNGTYLNVPSPISGSYTGGFDIDSKENIWYTNWMLRQGGALVKFDYTQFSDFTAIPDNSTALQFSDVYNLPADLGTPVGLVVDDSDNVWIADTSSSAFFRFDPISEEFTKYTTSDPRPSTFGNQTGIIKTPMSGPYWIDLHNNKLVFNEQLANSIGVFDIGSESLIEYIVPSKNPNWADCGALKDCGVAQIFGHTTSGDKVWFTEWVENNIGVVDLSRQLPVDMTLPQTVLLAPGHSSEIELGLNPNLTTEVEISAKSASSFRDVVTDLQKQTVSLDGSKTVPITISANESALPGTYKLLFSARTGDVTVSQFVTVIVTQ